MKELKCPKCGNVFSVDEADYAFIANQVRNEEFDAELNRRIEELHQQQLAQQQLEDSRQERALAESQLKHQEELALHDKKHQEELNEKEKRHLSELNKAAQALHEKEASISSLKQRLENLNEVKKLEIAAALAEKEKTINQLRSQLEQTEQNEALAILKEQNSAKDEISQKDIEITRLKGEVEKKETEITTQLAIQKDKFEGELQRMKEQVDYYKDLKTRMSTKMVGETLEIHCSTEFNRIRSLFPNAYFEKDNDITAEGNTKGDFIFRDFDDGTEYVSIMFEMKNEMNETAVKHTNESFFKKLDSDRKAKNCEFAVLVSLLEPDSELYNTGIVDVSHRYPKMYVIRPQFFIPLITLLVQTSRKSLEYKRQLAIAQNQSIDVTNFENKLLEFKHKFGYNYELASRKFKAAIDGIDKTITQLTTIREALVGSANNLRLANNRAEDLSIKKLTRGNKTMKAMFEAAKQVDDIEDLTEPEPDETEDIPIPEMEDIDIDLTDDDSDTHN